MDCRTADKMIIRYIQRELDDDETAAFLKHIRTCQSCRNELEINEELLDAPEKINEDALTIRRLIASGVKQAEIARLLDVTRQKVSYWVNKDVSNYKKRKKNLANFM